MRQLGELEAAIMDRLWTWQQPATVREVLTDLSGERKLAYTTVMTVLDNLHRKGVVSREPDGRAFRYTPVQDRAEYSAELIAAVLADADDRTIPLLRFVDQLTPAEIDRLRSALEAAAPSPAPARKRRPR